MPRKRKVLTLEERVDVIRKFDKGSSCRTSQAKSGWEKRRYRVLSDTKKTY